MAEHICIGCGVSFWRKGRDRKYCSHICYSDNQRGKVKPITHGHAGRKKSPTYLSWRSMKLRCTNPSQPGWARYGGAGITVCARWQTFDNFLADMGERPEGMTLDRIDSHGNYEPSNCQWATRKTQQQNRDFTVWIEHDGRRLCLTDWAKETGLGLTTIKYRIDAGWNASDALTKPLRRGKAA